MMAHMSQVKMSSLTIPVTTKVRDFNLFDSLRYSAFANYLHLLWPLTANYSCYVWSVGDLNLITQI